MHVNLRQSVKLNHKKKENRLCMRRYTAYTHLWAGGFAKYYQKQGSHFTVFHVP